MSEANLPEFFRLRQRLASQAIEDVAATVTAELRKFDLGGKLGGEQTVGIAVGSRGIANLQLIVDTVVRFVATCGCRPVIIPAMGSHGGATAAGQTAVLAAYGIDADSLGCAVHASMDTVQIGELDDGAPIHFSAACAQLDHLIVINRVKPHTRLVGELQSGLAKMLMIGLGKRDGAASYHQVFPDYDFEFARIARRVIPLIIGQMPVTMGLAIVEDAFDQTSIIEAIAPELILQREPKLLAEAQTRLPSLPFDNVDLLIIDRIGKEISGTGMDTNVVGRKTNDRAAMPDEFPKVRQIYVRALSEHTAGNASGIGIAEYCHARVIEQMNTAVTRMNCLTSSHVSAAAIPVSFASDHETLDVAMTQGTRPCPDQVRWLHIADTLHLAKIKCSRRYWDEAGQRDDLAIESELAPLRFNPTGDLLDG